MYAVYVFVSIYEDWIDRADYASQTGLPKPPFETEHGEPIFPEHDEPWWLTDVCRRADPGDRGGVDEDGPPSDFEEDKPVEVSASEDSDREAACVDAVSSGYEPEVAWTR